MYLIFNIIHKIGYIEIFMYYIFLYTQKFLILHCLYFSSLLNANARIFQQYKCVNSSSLFMLKLLLLLEKMKFFNFLWSLITASNEIDVDSKDSKDQCAEAKEECNIIRCPYGKEQYVDSQDCERCRCVDPCRTKICPEGTRCAITLVATQDGTEYKGVCQSSKYCLAILFLNFIKIV